MASTKEFLDYILELLKEVDDVTYKKMMGEYLLYAGGILFGGVYDNRFLIKISDSLSKYGFKEEIPYPTGKSMFLIDIEDPREIYEVVSILLKDLVNARK